jgi:hypothetical protein
MLYNNAARSNLGQEYWESWRVGGTHTRDTGEKGRKYLLRVLAQFWLSELRYKILIIFKFPWGQSVAWLKFGGIV